MSNILRYILTGMFLSVWVSTVLKVTFLMDGLAFKKIVEWLYVALCSLREL